MVVVLSAVGFWPVCNWVLKVAGVGRVGILVIHEPTRRVLRMSLTFNGMMGMAGGWKL